MIFDNNLITLATAFFALIIGGAISLPRIMSGKKRDEGDMLFAESQQKLLHDMQALFATQMDQMRITTDQLNQSNEHMSYRIKQLRLEMEKLQSHLIQTKALLFEFENLLINAGIDVPPDVQQRMKDLMEAMK